MHLQRVLESCLYARDLARAESFYSEILGLTVFSRAPGRHVFFRCGSAMVLIFNPQRTTEAAQEVPAHGAHGEGHIAFAVAEDDMPRWRQHLAERGVAIEAEVQWPGGGMSLYFRDPAGNSLELATPAIWGLPD